MLAKTDFPIGLDAKTREAFKKTFDAMSEWRDETTASTERYAERVFDTFAVAARGVGWPEGLVETTKIQLLQASKMQTQMMDRVMETWQDQLKSPVSPGQFLGKFAQGASGTVSRTPWPIRRNSGCRRRRCGRRTGWTRWRSGWAVSLTDGRGLCALVAIQATRTRNNLNLPRYSFGAGVFYKVPGGQ